MYWAQRGRKITAVSLATEFYTALEGMRNATLYWDDRLGTTVKPQRCENFGTRAEVFASEGVHISEAFSQCKWLKWD